MVNRRRFLTLSSLAGLLPSLSFSAFKSVGSHTKASSLVVRPLAIATWDRVKATEAAQVVLERGGRALDAVEAGVRIPEADPDDMTVGYGGRPDRDGHVTLDACIMDDKGNAGSVTFLEHIMHPISVARAVMEKTPHVMLSGEGALNFALSQGFKKENLLTKKAEKEWREWLKTAQYKPIVNIERHDTIGMLAIDSVGNISGACTTSGLAYKMRGRVGDSPIIGAGLFVDNEIGGACATGLGELVMRTCGSFLVVELMRQGRTPQQACEEAALRIVKKQDFKDIQVGFVAINKKGEHGAFSIQPGFSYTLSQNKKTQVTDAKSYLK
ncbi:N(4)-(beta-N-acetylglucosaminyl)-L-asparaginase [Spirosoma endophyticum]|uniref:N4-(Beta-N-acetylglucosaminyl)-L-asparaginase n=1 Tax=Spirosoma endophyticum TaxID=662367 RepID=A0A1I1PIC1_9BACT|nr:N(4)-(beta-N-acetylglucosaminyl)-L-asparaginase [Spirosoma endophyticum]SFD09517.1 N4-(beta-N-acetylglucosaminyl)-L-asparaginase [Spirosoma endophyticum]